jgi:3'-phosphoadenosine 5'-phosphosulfate sulfotransferase (PAPS reductase)/FAD synthetase
MKHIASCSFGKDSVATALLAIEHDEPLDELVYCEVMFDEKISGEIPEHIDFIYNTAIPYFERHGIKTRVIRSDKHTYVSGFTKVIEKGKRVGQTRGFPLCNRCYIQRDCKLRPVERYKNTLPKGTVRYIGIASDEQERLLRLGTEQVSLLDKYGYTEQDAKALCEKHGLLSPIYEFTDRGGCWFCPNAKMRELRHLYDHHPDLWKRMLELQALPNKCTELFNRTMKFSDIDYNFRMDDAQMKFDFPE